MSCAETRKYLQTYADGELDAVTSSRVHEHLTQCSGCQHALERIGSLRSLVRESASYYRAPQGLTEKVRARIGGAAQTHHRHSSVRLKARPQTRWAWPVLRFMRAAGLVALTAVVTWLTSVSFNTPSREETLLAQVSAAHSRAVVTTHVADVASSDQHTVKPWLSSKLDFSPPVSDLTTQGFPLVGGRVDYLDERPVAALVYRHRQHVIDVFVWPDEAAQSPLRAASKHGYNILHWTSAGMTFWAISDLNAADMQAFVDTYSHAK